jgi:hypothetical protein
VRALPSSAAVAAVGMTGLVTLDCAPPDKISMARISTDVPAGDVPLPAGRHLARRFEDWVGELLESAANLEDLRITVHDKVVGTDGTFDLDAVDAPIAFRGGRVVRPCEGSTRRWTSVPQRRARVRPPGRSGRPRVVRVRASRKRVARRAAPNR